MRISGFTTIRPNMSETRTYEDFSKFLGTRPERLGLVARLYPHLTASYLTDALRNVFYADSNKTPKFQSINAMMFEWELETNYIKRVEIAARPADVNPGCECIIPLKEHYYDQNDIFKNDITGEQFFVVSAPVRKADNYWEYHCRMVSDVYDAVPDFSFGWEIGDTTRFIGNAFPELHEFGFVKYQSNVEKHRGYITTHRVDVSWSAQYAAHEDMFISIGDGKDSKETVYRMDKKEKVLLENFLTVRNNMLLFAKTNVDENGKCNIVDKDTNRPIYIGDGLIPQVERFASKYAYNRLTIETLNTAIMSMIEKAENPQGNHFAFICNEKFFGDLQTTLSTFLSNFHTDGCYLWSKQANKYIKVGATFDSYEYMGNTISFKVDRTFSREFGQDKGYCLCLDLTADSTSNQPPISLFTLKGGDFITNKVLGVGGENGLSSGTVSTPVAGSKLINWGYSGIAVYNPYRSYILREI